MKGFSIYEVILLGLSAVASLGYCAATPPRPDHPGKNPAAGATLQASGLSEYAQSVFRFSYPAGWTEFTESEKRAFKQQFEAQSRDIFKAYHGRPEGYETLVPHIFGIRAPKEVITCIGVLMRIPAQAKDYIDTIYQRSNEVLDWGKREGRLKEVISNRKAKIGNVPALISELVWANGERHTGITFHFPDATTYGGSILIINKNPLSEETQKQVKSIVDSLVLVAPKQ
jgi:hypothetical protein